METSGSSAATSAAGAASPSPWPTDSKQYELVDEIGQGAFAKVWKAKCVSKDAWVAVKIIDVDKISTAMEDIQSEVRAMKMCRHKNVLPLHCCFNVGTDLWLVMPLMDKGSCFYMLRTLRKRGEVGENDGLSEEWIQVILKETLQGLHYLHESKQIHRDVKAGNILVNSDGDIKLADFGVAGWMSDGTARGDGQRETFVGTPCWMAPEVMEQSKGYNERADIWSLGITAFELARGYAPYSKYAPMQVLIKTLREPPPTLESYENSSGKEVPKFSAKFKNFVARCLVKDPKNRPSAGELLHDKFIKGAPAVDKFRKNFLHKIPTVSNQEAASLDQKPKGYAAYTINLPDLVPGTTWDFCMDHQEGQEEQSGVEDIKEEDLGGERADPDSSSDEDDGDE